MFDTLLELLTKKELIILKEEIIIDMYRCIDRKETLKFDKLRTRLYQIRGAVRGKH